MMKAMKFFPEKYIYINTILHYYLRFKDSQESWNLGLRIILILQIREKIQRDNKVTQLGVVSLQFSPFFKIFEGYTHNLNFTST